jgi:transposase
LRRIKRKLLSHDPQRLAILSRLRAIVRRLGPNGTLLFFDIKPVAVKAYGGRLYSSAKRLVLERRQKTRGFFSLCLSYDLRRGRVHWAFLPGKSAKDVCQFMRRVRDWYPDQEIWIGLDQDRAHPRKCRQTRRTMRELKLHWVSLPKGSPDDNPVETAFSDVQGSILECSNDPDAKTTQRRISAHLRNRNRRRDRHIQISYLPDTHKD